MAEAELHKARIQALAEKRQRQTEIEDKRRQLEDLILKLQHLKSKAMRERWLLQGTTSGMPEEENTLRRQTEQDDLQVKCLEDIIHRLESDISLLEREELEISAKEQLLREKLRETEKSIEDLQKSLQKQDGGDSFTEPKESKGSRCVASTCICCVPVAGEATRCACCRESMDHIPLHPSPSLGEVSQASKASPQSPVTTIHMGRNSVARTQLGTVTAEIVLIDEDDEKSLREKTVTDVLPQDSSAADLVSGQPEGDDHAVSFPVDGTPAGLEMTAENVNTLNKVLKPSGFSEDESTLNEETVSNVSLNQICMLIEGNMELQTPLSKAHPNNPQEFSPNPGVAKMRNRHESLDSDVAKEIMYLDEVLETSICDSNNFNSDSPFLSANIETSESSLSDKLPQYNYDDQENLSSTNDSHKSCLFGTEAPRNYSHIREPAVASIKNETRFEIRALHEERKPSKLFDNATDKPFRVKKVRPSEEVAELERERQELIRGQAVKKNPGIASKWWNPHHEKTLEEELDANQLESHKKYEIRKQKKSESAAWPQTSPRKPSDSQALLANAKSEETAEEQTGFVAQKTQFLPVELPEYSEDLRKEQDSKLNSRKHSVRVLDGTNVECGLIMDDYTTEDITKVSSLNILDSPGITIIQNPIDSIAENMRDNLWTDMEDFTCVKAVMTVLKDDDLDISTNGSCHLDEIDSGLDDLSLQSQDTTVPETLCNNFFAEGVIRCQLASLEDPAEYVIPSTRCSTQYISNQDYMSESDAKSFCINMKLGASEDRLHYNAYVLDHGAIKQTLSQECPHEDLISDSVSECETTRKYPEPICMPFPSSQQPRQHKTPDGLHGNKKTVLSPVDTPDACQLPDEFSPAKKKQEFSYFSKYSEAAELRSTASVTHARDPEVSSGPFRLRSHKQRTLSMIEEEIRAAQEREEELKRQRETQILHQVSQHKQNRGKHSISGRTTPGKIEKLAVASASEVPEVGDESAASQRPKNLLQTLMEDYENHKVMCRDKAEGMSVLESTRVTRRKSDMALRWEAGMYANEECVEKEE